MDGMEEKLNSILSNPQMMKQIMSLAQSINPESAPSSHTGEGTPAGSTPDLKLLSGIANITGSSSIDRNQQALLHALNPYLSKGKLNKLEKAMRAAKMAGLASALVGSPAAPHRGRG